MSHGRVCSLPSNLETCAQACKEAGLRHGFPWTPGTPPSIGGGPEMHAVRAAKGDTSVQEIVSPSTFL
eukprot:5967815-Amphidinium_carterae.1